ncbi:MAG: polysaccharide deacetylase family protein, partial [Candidatus Eremiobacteraeota bacterium]|nr:polysaccharide deacetylase family protein [Candidatus Eremiobacteraeota bacterium]
MPFPWPEGRRVAVCLTWDVDGESALYFRFPDRAKNLLGELHQRAFGPQIGVGRVLRLLERHGIPGTFYIPSYIALVHREEVTTIARAGHPIGLHGHLHEALELLSEAEENAVLATSRRILGEVCGYEPTLYRAPAWELNRRTPEILVRHGCRSDSSLMDDEVPYALETPAGELIEIPIQWALDDAEYWAHSRANRDKALADPDTVFRWWSTEFDGFYKEGGCYVLTLHPFISGRHATLQSIERLIQHISGFDGVWWTTMEAVTAHAER